MIIDYVTTYTPSKELDKAAKHLRNAVQSIAGHNAIIAGNWQDETRVETALRHLSYVLSLGPSPTRRAKAAAELRALADELDSATYANAPSND